jgi:hypothetical protein
MSDDYQQRKEEKTQELRKFLYSLPKTPILNQEIYLPDDGGFLIFYSEESYLEFIADIENILAWPYRDLEK